MDIRNYDFEINDWHFVNDVHFDKKKYTALDPNTLVFRNYTNKAGKIVNLCVVYHKNERWGAHDPIVCYYSHGWEILKQPNEVYIPFEGQFLVLNKFVAQKGNIKSIVYYNWFSSNKKITPSRNKQLFDMFLHGIIYGYTESGFLRFSINVDPFNEKESVAVLNDFMGKFMKDFLKE